MFDAEMNGLDVMFLVVNGGELLPTTFVLARYLLPRIFFRFGPLPRHASHLPIMRIGGK